MDIDERPDPAPYEVHDYRAIGHTREGHVAGVWPLVATSDADAIAQTTALVRDLAVDLWDGLRFVEHFAGRLVGTGCLCVAAGLLGGL